MWLKHGGDAKIAWDVQRKIDVIYQSANVFTVKLFESVEQGTAHPAQNTVYFNFRPDSGRLIQLTDLIAAEDLEKFGEVVNKHLKKSAKKSPEGEDTKEPGQETELPKNFAIERDGLRFRYEEGQVDPNSDKIPEFLVRYSEIKKLLRPDARVPVGSAPIQGLQPHFGHHSRRITVARRGAFRKYRFDFFKVCL